MKPQTRFLKLIVACEVFVEDGKWCARSDSLGSIAYGETPEGAVESLKDTVQRAENEAARERNNKLAAEAKKRVEEAKKLKAERKAADEAAAELLKEKRKERMAASGQETEGEDSEAETESGEETEQGIEGEDFDFDEDEEGEGVDAESLTRADVATLRQIAEERGIEHEGLGKVALREKLIEELVDEDE